MVEAVGSVISSREICVVTKYDRNPTEAAVIETETPGDPWKLVEMDIFVWERKKYLTVVDRFSKIARVRVVTNMSAVNITETVLELFSQYGCPKKGISDRDSLRMPG